MVRCKKCRREIYDSTYTCPHCGTRQADYEYNYEDYVIIEDKNTNNNNNSSDSSPFKAPGLFPEEFNILSAYKSYFKNALNFKDRTTRMNFWSVYIINNFLIIMLFGMGFETFGTYLSYFLFIPDLAIFARRLHDSGKKATWLLLLIVPYVGSIILLVMLMRQTIAFDEYKEV